MKSLIAGFLAFGLLNFTYVHADPSPQPKPDAKSVEGTWEGTLNVGAVKLRLAFKIKKKADGSLTATMDSIDQGAKDIPVHAVTWRDPDLKMELKKIGGVFEGNQSKARSDRKHSAVNRNRLPQRYKSQGRRCRPCRRGRRVNPTVSSESRIRNAVELGCRTIGLLRLNYHHHGDTHDG